MVHPIVILAAAVPMVQAVEPVLPPESKRRGMALIALVILLGVILLSSTVALILLGQRRRRLNARPAKPRVSTPDPWTESARRMNDGGDGFFDAGDSGSGGDSGDGGGD